VLHNDDTTVKILERMARTKPQACAETDSPATADSKATAEQAHNARAVHVGRDRHPPGQRIALFSAAASMPARICRKCSAGAPSTSHLIRCDALSRNLPRVGDDRGPLSGTPGGGSSTSRPVSAECRFVLEAFNPITTTVAREQQLSPQNAWLSSGQRSGDAARTTG
jgi:hypothetical protein